MVFHQLLAKTTSSWMCCILFFLQICFSQGYPNCISQGKTYCNADPHCAAFGLLRDTIQLHGCDNETVPNNDWTIYAKATNYSPLAGHVNINEAKCTQHPKSMTHQCKLEKYTVQGSIDVGTFENSIFMWNNTMYLLENIPCGYIDHAGHWFPEFDGHSYARIRLLDSGHVVANISSTIAHSFISAFPDYNYNRVWLFGVNSDRCRGTHKGSLVQAWWSENLVDWETGVAVPNYNTYNTEVSAVPKPPAGMPQHRYVMILESFGFMINNDPDGNLTRPGSWVLVNSTAPRAPSGGPSIRFSNGFYYIFTGGFNVFLYRSNDLRNWVASPHNPLIKPTPADAKIAPYAGFAASAARKGFTPMKDNWTLWDWNSNDGDVCCMTPASNMSWLIWGASTQGRKPTPPVTHGSTNAIGTSKMRLSDLLAAYFQ